MRTYMCRYWSRILKWMRANRMYWREFILFFTMILTFPFRTIRIYMWKWFFWLVKNERQVIANHNNYFTNKHKKYEI